MEDLIEEIAMGPFGSNIKVDCFVESGIPVLNGSNLQGFKLNEGSFNYVTPKKADSLNKANAYRGDIVITHRGTLGQIVYIPADSLYDRYVISQSQFRIRLNTNLALPEYVVYFFHTRIGQHRLLANASQVGVPAIARPTTTFRKIEIELPALNEQKRIVEILDSLSNKIALNNRINHNLEEQTLALYKSWFIDYKPFKDEAFDDSEKGMVPKGWKVKRLGDLCTCVLGGTPSRNHPEYWGGSIGWINSGAVNEFRITEPSEFITDKGLRSSATKLLPANTVVIAITGATLGQYSILSISSCANQSVIGILENTKVPTEYIYPFIAFSIDDLLLSATGGAQQHINKNNVENLNIIIPPEEIMKAYSAVAKNMFEEITVRSLENKKLCIARDSLLPRLMSSE